MGSNEFVDIDYDEVLVETEMAVLFRAGDDEFWIPKSVMESPPENGEVGVRVWFAEKEGLV